MNFDPITLVHAYLDGEMNAAEQGALREWLDCDEANVDRFVAECRIHSELWDKYQSEEKQIDGMAIPDAPYAVPSLSPLPSHLSPSFVGGPIFSYMVATVVLCLMLLGAWAYKITHDRDFIAVNSRRSTTSGPAERVFVGQITGTKDCRWSDSDTQTIVGAAVSLDREYALTSGLLEITYKTGAKVILEGPCNYKVESSASGFLERGKLTARIVQRGPVASAAGAKPQALFSVRTPTALITDLGTEFGVEVDENGDTISHVFQGSVRVEVSAVGGTGSASGTRSVVLRENESVLVKKDEAEMVRFSRPTTTTPPWFVREMPPMQTANGSMPAMDSADFPWTYEMDVDPAAQDLDGNPGPDWKLHRGAVKVNGDGTATLAALNDSYGCLTSNGPDDPDYSPGHVWNNITNDTGYTVELRVKTGGTADWHGYTMGMYFRTADSRTEQSSVLAILNEATVWDHTSQYLADNNRNDDDFHVFRIAQEPDSGRYHVWRDGVLIRLSEGFQPTVWNRVQFGDMGVRGGPNVVDYVRLTAGAYAPPKRATSTTPCAGSDNKKEEPLMKH